MTPEQRYAACLPVMPARIALPPVEQNISASGAPCSWHLPPHLADHVLYRIVLHTVDQVPAHGLHLPDRPRGEENPISRLLHVNAHRILAQTLPTDADTRV